MWSSGWKLLVELVEVPDLLTLQALERSMELEILYLDRMEVESPAVEE
jgi:hypothetical protein